MCGLNLVSSRYCARHHLSTTYGQVQPSLFHETGGSSQQSYRRRFPNKHFACLPRQLPTGHLSHPLLFSYVSRVGQFFLMMISRAPHVLANEIYYIFWGGPPFWWYVTTSGLNRAWGAAQCGNPQLRSSFKPSRKRVLNAL